MITNRKKLLDTLVLVKPAISSKDIIEQFTNIWFDGENIAASNDLGMGILAPFKTEFKGGVKGTQLIGLINNMKVKDIELSPEGESLIVRGGKARAKLAMMPIDKISISIPKESDNAYIPKAEFYGALGQVLRSSGNVKSAVPEQAGVTLIKDGHAFATDADTISWVHGKCETPERVTMPIAFVEVLLDISKGMETHICFKKSNVYAKNKKAFVFSPLLGSDEPQDLVGMAEKVTKDAVYVPIPARLKLALERALVMLDRNSDIKVKVLTKGAALRIITTVGQGELKDSIALDKEVPETELTLDPKMIKRGLSSCDKI